MLDFQSLRFFEVCHEEEWYDIIKTEKTNRIRTSKLILCIHNPDEEEIWPPGPANDWCEIYCGEHPHYMDIIEVQRNFFKHYF